MRRQEASYFQLSQESDLSCDPEQCLPLSGPQSLSLSESWAPGSLMPALIKSRLTESRYILVDSLHVYRHL